MRKLILILALLATCTPLAAHPGACKLTIIDTPTLIVDPACPNCDGGVLDIQLRNDNKTSVPLLLTLGNLTDKTSKTPINAGLSLQLFDGVTGQPFESGKTKAGKAEPKVAPNYILLVRVRVSRILQEGQWQAEIYNRGVDLGSFTVIRSHLPFNVTLVTPKPDAPEITLNRKLPASLTLSNADPVTYSVGLKLVVKGSALQLADVTLPPGGSATVPLDSGSTCCWFDHPWQGRFVDETTDGQLVLTLKPPCKGQCQGQAAPASPRQASPGDQSQSLPASLSPVPTAKPCPTDQCKGQAPPANPHQASSPDQSQSAPGSSAPGSAADQPQPSSIDAPNKLIKVTVHLAYYSRSEQFRYILLLLLAGAACSLFLSAYIPNQQLRIQARKQLDELAARIRDLPMRLASRLRVSVGLERRRLQEVLDSFWGFQPGLSAVIDDVNRRIDTLGKRLKLAQELGELRLRFDGIQRSESLFPTPMEKLAGDFESAVDALSKLEFSDTNVVESQNRLKDLRTQVDNLEDIKKFFKQEPELVQRIFDRARQQAGKIPEAISYTETISRTEKRCPLAAALFRRMQQRLEKIFGKIPAAEDAAAAGDSAAPRQPEGGQAPTDAASQKGANDKKSVEGFPPELLPDLRDLDRLSHKMEMLVDCLRLLPTEDDLKELEAANASKKNERDQLAAQTAGTGGVYDEMIKLYERMASKCEDLAELLESQNPENFEAALRLEREIKEHIFSEDVENKITKGATSREPDKLRDWGKHARWPRGVSVLALVCLALLNIFAPPPAWITLVLLIVLVIGVLLSLDTYAALLAKAAAKRDRTRPLREEKAVMVADSRVVRIEPDTSETRVYEGVQLRVRFCQEQLNASAAVGDITPIWNFGHDNLTPEEGWEVVHYFPRPGCYRVEVKFQRRAGEFLIRLPDTQKPSGDQADTADAHRGPGGHCDIVYAQKKLTATSAGRGIGLWASWLNVVWLMVALFPAVLALYTGAMDQLQKLDFIPGLIAVFMAGFTSDQVKNLLTQKPK